MTTLERPAVSREEDFIRALSKGGIVAIRPSGPVFARGRPRRRCSRPGTFVPALPRRARVAVAALTVAWVATYVIFWIWWLLPQHRTDALPFTVNTVILAWVSTVPVYFLLTANRLQRVSPTLEIPQVRVAMVVTKAPSEPWPLTRTTIEAMLCQDFPYAYDVWLCDEDPTDETLAWCHRNRVRVSTRRGVQEYQRETWPRRRRCKEGNLAYFYDRFGYRDYDVVSQLDCDHVPEPTYLAEMVRPFADPAIGYVGAPSVCGKNRHQSWAVRGRLFVEATFHGAHQLGHNGHKGDLAPVCIGSHYAVRTTALASIGGIGPELAEDFSTSYLMNVAGWCGAFAVDAHADGDGPTDFPAEITQEFQWSRSLGVIMLNLMPRTLSRLPFRKRIRFGFALAWYPMLVATFAAGLSLTAAAAVFNIQWVRVNYFEFVVLVGALSCWLLAIYGVLRAHRLLRPNDAPALSWEGTFYVLTRWVYNGWGLLAALIQIVAPRPLELKVTPKNVKAVVPLPVRTVLPYMVIAAVLSIAALVGINHRGPVGYIFLCLLNAAAYVAVSVMVPFLHGYEAVRSQPSPARRFLALVGGTLLLNVLVVGLFVLAASQYPAYFFEEFRW